MQNSRAVAVHREGRRVNVVRVAGLRITDVARSRAVGEFESLLRSGRSHVATYVNPHACNVAAGNPEFARLMDRASIAWCDGTGVKWAARLLGIPLEGRFTFPQIAEAFFAMCAEKGLKLFAVGETTDDITAFAHRLRDRHPRLNLCGVHHGFFDMDSEEDRRLRETIKAQGPDFILVGMGMPKQEFWGDALVGELDRGVVICVGALFRYYAGLAYRGPQWMTENGMEWLWRLARHPIAYFNRYVVGNVRFLWLVFRHRRQKGAT